MSNPGRYRITFPGDAPLWAKQLETQFNNLFIRIAKEVSLGTTNQNVQVKSLSAASASGTSDDQDNVGGRGLHLYIKISAISGTTPTLTVTIQGKDEYSGDYYTLLQSPSLNATGTTLLKVYPGLTAAANSVANDVLPKTWRISYAITGTTPSVSATIGASVID